MTKTAAIILAGGKASRLKGINKSALTHGGVSFLDIALRLFSGKVDKVCISVGSEDRYQLGKSHPIVLDWPNADGKQGVALALLGGLDWAKKNGIDAIITTPVDTPFLPDDYVNLLKSQFTGETPVVCQTEDGIQGLHAIWPVTCFAQMKTAIVDNQIFKISRLHAELGSTPLVIPKTDRDQFLNINTQADLNALVG